MLRARASRLEELLTRTEAQGDRELAIERARNLDLTSQLQEKEDQLGAAQRSAVLLEEQLEASRAQQRALRELIEVGGWCSVQGG